MKCDRCDKKATVHDVLIKEGKPIDIHLCTDHAIEAGYSVIPEVSLQVITGKAKGASAQLPLGAHREKPMKCAACGLTFAAFRKTGRLGCSACYDAFMPTLGAVIERAQAGATSHIGRRPTGSDEVQRRQDLRMRLLKEIEKAIAAEQYERAAQIRDEIHKLDEVAQ